ncbi:hypothetical protein EDB86DRAFT_682811 [Lactarius hatsudake]|nr:hypothetical protein EDB86DRAFT_682811 [Lactarius hatsudake]
MEMSPSMWVICALTSHSAVRHTRSGARRLGKQRRRRSPQTSDSEVLWHIAFARRRPLGEPLTLVLRQVDRRWATGYIPTQTHAACHRDEILRPCFITVTCGAGPLSHTDRRLDPLCPSLAVRAASIDWSGPCKSSSSMTCGGGSDFRHATSTVPHGPASAQSQLDGRPVLSARTIRVIALAAPRLWLCGCPKNDKITTPRRVNHRVSD